ncbi:MAG: tetratricopeptide repeat protein [Candidatus Methanomethylophilaceae archaeon]
MGSEPVFRDRFDLDLWKRMESGNWKSDEQFLNWLDNLLDHEGNIDSAVLSRAIELVHERRCTEQKDLIIRLVSKSRPSDSVPALTAAQIFLETEDIDAAKEVAAKAKHGSIPLACCVRAKIDMAEGDQTAARKELVRARCSDPSFPMFYELIELIDPEGGWMYRRNIELLVSGKEPIPFGKVGEGGKPEALYEIYREWFRGSRDRATRAMVSSEEYRAKDPEYMLASARMSMDEKDWRSAQMMYDALLSKRPNCVYIICETADAYLRGKDYEHALSLYRDAESLDPMADPVMRGLIRAYRGCTKTDEAVQCMIEYLDTEEAHFGSYMRCSTLLYEWGKYNEALKAISPLLMTYPGDAKAGVLKSKIEVGCGDLDAALDAAGDAMRNNTKDKESRIQYASVLLEMGKTDRALREIERILKTDHDCLDALLVMLRIRIGQEDGNAVVDTCRKILDIDPMNKEASNAMSKAAVFDKKENAVEDLKAAVQGDADAHALIEMMMTLAENKRYGDAIKMCSEYGKRFGDDILVKRIKGNCEYQSGMYTKASVTFASAIAMDPRDPLLWHSKGMADEMDGDLDSAEEAFDKAVLLEPDEPEYWISRSSVREKRGDIPGAIDSMNRAISLDTHSSYPLVRKGMMFASLGKYEEALCFLDLAHASDSENKGILRLQRDICAAAGMADKAIGISENLLARDPSDPEAAGRLSSLYLSMDDTEKAQEVLDRALSKAGDSLYLLHRKKDLLMRLKDDAGSVEVCERILESDPKDRAVRSDLADIYARTGNMSKANRLYTEIQREEDNEKEESKPLSKVKKVYGNSYCEIARSMLKAGDLNSASRMADRALATDDGNTEFILLRAEIYERSGDPRSADAFLSDVVRKKGPISEICEAEGDLRSRMGDARGALSCYDAAISSGKVTSSLQMKRGFVQEGLGLYDGAISSFISAVIKDPKNVAAHRHMAVCQLAVGKVPAALKSIETAYVTDQTAPTLALRAKIFAEMGNREEVSSMYSQFLRCAERDDDSKKMITEALAKVGLNEDADYLSYVKLTPPKEKKPVEDKVPACVKRLAERVLRRAYMSGTPLSDPDLIEALDLDGETADAVLAYLSNMSEYGEIIPGTPEFDRMEKLSMNAIIKGNCVGLEKDPIISIPCAFVAGSTKDADEAKKLVAYIYKVMGSGTDNRVISGIGKDGLTKDMPVEDFVKNAHVGIYHAKALKRSMDQ